MKDIGILAFTDRGKRLAEKIAAQLESAEIFDHKKPAREFLGENFHQKDTFLFICAAGICVRLIAPLIRSKDVDPAVIVMDEFGRFAVPILSGHLGGANEAAAELAELTGCGTEVVLTTATDVNGKFAVDVWSKQAGCKIVNVPTIKNISSKVLKGEPVGLYTIFPIDGKIPDELTTDKEETDTGICVSLDGELNPFPNTLHAVPKIVTLGVGCRKDSRAEEFEKFVLQTLMENHVSIEAVEQIASIDIKRDEKCILDFSKKYNIPFITYSAQELMKAPGEYTASDFVKRITGADNVCERSAVLGSGNGKKILTKTSQSGFTAAMAMKDWKCKF